jgi:Zn-finger nucleic acid-binding protein
MDYLRGIIMEKSATTRITAFNCPNCGAAATPDSVQCSFCGSSLSVRICTACFGAVSIGMKHCPHCGAEVADTQPAAKGSFKCPRCETPLAEIAVGSHSIRGCTQCGGFWVKKDIFQVICTREEDQEAVLGYSIPEPPPPDPKKPQRAYIPCPECGKLMNHKNFAGCSGVILDWCSKHGSWFDRQELHRIVTFIRGGGMRKAREREQSQLQEQKDRLRTQELQMAALGRRLDTNFDRTEYQSSSDPIMQFLNRMFR